MNFNLDTTVIEKKIDFWIANKEVTSLNLNICKKNRLSPKEQMFVNKMLKTQPKPGDKEFLNLKRKVISFDRKRSEINKKSDVQISFWRYEKFSTKNKPFKKKIGTIVYRILNFFIKNDTAHVDMNIISQRNKLNLVGWGYGGGYESEDYAKVSRSVDVYDLNINKIFGLKVSDKQKAVFIKNLNLLSDSKPFKSTIIPGNAIFNFIPAFNHRCKKAVSPEEIYNEYLNAEQENKSLKAEFCSSVPVRLIITAHIKTCKETGIHVPQKLSHYGFDDRENISHITPNRLTEKMVKKRFLKEKISPFSHK